MPAAPSPSSNRPAPTLPGWTATRGVFAKWFGLSFVGLGLFLGLLLSGFALLDRARGVDYATTTGTVTKVVKIQYRDPETHDVDTTWWSQIAYEVEGQTYTISDPSRHSEGDLATVFYDPDRPAEGVASNPDPERLFWILAASLGTPFLLAGLAIWIWAIRTTDWSTVNPSRRVAGGSWRWGSLPPSSDEPADVRRGTLADSGFPAYPTEESTADQSPSDDRDLR